MMKPKEAQSRTIYYQASPEQQIDNRPFFFGWAEVSQKRITGRHYKPKLDQTSGRYTIGFYTIEGETENFLKTLDTDGVMEITPEAFNIALSQWTRDGKQDVAHWGSGLVWEIAKA